MAELETPIPEAPAPTPEATDRPDAPARFEVYRETRPQGLLRRYFVTQRHLTGTVAGGLVAYVRSRPAVQRRGLRFLALRLLAWLVRPFVKHSLVGLPFPVQLRRRLELLGPTYIKLGQILSLREDLLPRQVTEELKTLLDRLPAVPYPRFVELVEAEIGRSVRQAFRWIAEEPLGSASIGQIHRATTLDGESVILKVVKPGIRETVRRDVVLLRVSGRLLQILLPRYQPRRVAQEFCDYTLREVDLRREAENAEIFAANFEDQEDVVFPRIFREFTTESLLVMEFLEGYKPTAPQIQRLDPAERDRIIDLGAEAVIRMLYRDGFFHADLHPGNLLVLPGPKAGFIDLGMVGRFDEDLRRTLLYYFFCLVMGDAENAARYLAAIARQAPGGDAKGFRRDVEEISRRWQRSANFEDFSIARLIMESVAKGAAYRMYFPVEMVLMVKAIVTFEAVGQALKPGFDVAAVCRPHINRLLMAQFSPVRLARETLRGTPELVDALVKAPMLITEGLRVLEQSTQRQPENPFAGIRGTVFAGFCLVAGAILVAFQGPWPIWALLFLVGILLALRRSR